MERVNRGPLWSWLDRFKQLLEDCRRVCKQKQEAFEATRRRRMMHLMMYLRV